MWEGFLRTPGTADKTVRMKRSSYDPQGDVGTSTKKTRAPEEDDRLLQVLSVFCGKNRVVSLGEMVSSSDLLHLSVCSKDTFGIVRHSVEDHVLFDPSLAPWKMFSPRCLVFKGRSVRTGCIPSDCRYLAFWHPMVLPELPDTLERLVLLGRLSDYDFSLQVERQARRQRDILLPERVTNLLIEDSCGVPKRFLPQGLKTLSVGIYAGESLIRDISSDSFTANLNQGLQSLLVFQGLHISTPLRGLPPHLTSLYLPDNFDQPIHFPPTLRTLVLGTGTSSGRFRYPLRGLPEGLVRLDIHMRGYWQPLDNLPKSLRVLILGDEVESRVDLPEGLCIFSPGSSYAGRLHVRVPASLRFILLTPACLRWPDDIMALQDLILTGWRVTDDRSCCPYFKPIDLAVILQRVV